MLISCIKRLLAVLCLFGPIISSAQTYYYSQTKKSINGTVLSGNGGGQFITFTDSACYDSDAEGYSVNNGVMKYNRRENGMIYYSGSSYWGKATYIFTSDKSNLNVRLASGDVYVYTRTTPPSNARTCSLIRSNNSNTGGVVVPVMPVGGSGYVSGGTPVSNGSSNTSTSSSNPRTITYEQVMDTCPECHGYKKCTHCHGKGYVDSFGSAVVRCTWCGGTGTCNKCHGSGLIQVTKQVLH